MKTLCHQVLDIALRVIWIILWIGLLLGNTICYVQDRTWVNIVGIIISAIYLILNILFLVFGFKSLVKLCDTYDEKLSQIISFIKNKGDEQ